MKLAVFDIDGTLTLGDGLGTRCFFAAFDEVFGGGRVEPRLDGYTHSTDCRIAREAAATALGRPAADFEIERFKSIYLARLQDAVDRRPAAYRPVPGAGDFLAALRATPDWKVAVATGNWRRAAAIKLDCAGIRPPPATACSEDGATRSEVLAAAVRNAGGAAGFDAVVYVGDQPWDLHAAREFGAGFVGVASDDRGRRLEAQGARLLDSYVDAATFLAALEEAAGIG